MNVNIRIRDTVKGEKISARQLGEDFFEYTGYPMFRDLANNWPTNATHQGVDKSELEREQHDVQLYTVICGGDTNWKSMHPMHASRLASVFDGMVSTMGKQLCKGHTLESNYLILEEREIEIFRNVHALMIDIQIQEIPGNSTKAPITTSLIYKRTTIDQHPIFFLGGAGYDDSGILQFQMVSESVWMRLPLAHLQLSTKPSFWGVFICPPIKDPSHVDSGVETQKVFTIEC